MTSAVEAIRSLLGPVELIIRDDDLSNIEWISAIDNPPTSDEIQAEMKRLDDISAQNLNAAIEHAKSLGFTDAMIAVMYPNLGAQSE